MRFSQFAQSCAGIALAVIAAPALAGAQPVGGEPPLYQPGVAPVGPDTRPEWREGAPQAARYDMDPGARDAWLSECRRRVSGRDSGIGGALIGGAVGGLAGNRIGGRGNRTVGTVAGAVVGAVAGAAIDRGEDRGRVRDECESYLDSYYDYYAGRQSYGYQPTPVAMAPRGEPECTETVEYVDEDVPVRPKVRRIPARSMKTVPDKRIRTN